MERSANNPNTRFSRTLYSYGALTSDTTTITRKKYLTVESEPQNYDGSEDEVATYEFYGYTDTNPDPDIFVKTYIKSVTDPTGLKTQNDSLDSEGRPISISTWEGQTKLGWVYYTYNSKGAVTSITRYDGNNGQLSTETNTYYADGSDTVWLDIHTDIRGKQTKYVRNANSLWQVDAMQIWDTSLQTPAWRTVREYDYYALDCTDGMAGQLWKETVPDIDGTTDQVTEYKYGYGVTGKWRTSPTQTVYSDASGTPRTSSTVYDDMGKVLSTTDANSRTGWYRYDALGRQTLMVYKWVNDVVDGTPEVYTQKEYSCCNLLWSRDENGNKTYYDYDDANRVIGTWTDIQGDSSSTNRLVSYDYDTFGNRHTVTTYSDASTPRVTTYTYDKNNRMTKIVYPSDIIEGDLLGNEEFGYDDLGNLWWKKDRNGAVTLYKYDTRNRLTDVYYNYTGSLTPPSYSGLTADVTYDYEGDSGLRTSMVDSSGESSYAYDDQARLNTYTPPVGLSTGYYVDYDYNDLGQKTRVRINNGTTTNYDVSYDYFANGWLKEVKSGANSIAAYSYDYAGNRTIVTLGNETYTSYDFDTDPRYRVDSISHYKSGTPDVLLAEIEYATRDNVGSPKSMTDWTGIWNYDFDANNRITTATPPNPIPDQPAGGDYGYDWVGNRLNPPTGTNHMVYNKVDQLIGWPGMHAYSYYADGSMHQVKDTSGTNVLRSYTYTHDGLLDAATYNGRTLTNTWDASKNRVSFVAGGNTHTFVDDITAGIPAVIKEDGAYYIREPNGSLIARVSGTDTSYYHFDALGSTRLLTDGDGDITDKYAYDAYGALIAHDQFTGSIDQPYQYVGRLGYYTHYQDPDFGLLQLGVRFYDPETGRFTSSDPARVGVNYFLGMNANPVYRVDPWGLWSFSDWIDWYYNHNGDLLDLDVHAPDLMNDIRWLSPVQSMVGEIKAIQDQRAKEKASNACKGCSGGNVTVRWPVSGSRGPDLTWYNFVIGDTSFYIKGNCAMKVNCCKRKYEYVCGVDFTLRDWFRDPLDIGVELPGGTPYEFTGTWTENFYGQGGF